MSDSHNSEDIQATCEHASITCTSSRNSQIVGFRRPSENERHKATRLNRANPREKGQESEYSADSAATYPSPLVLPDDGLAVDPQCPSQSAQEWIKEKERNPVTKNKNVIYIVSPPECSKEVVFAQTWVDPPSLEYIPPPSISDIVDYLAAFYDGLPVKLLPKSKLKFAAWDSGNTPASKAKTRSTTPRYIALNTETESIRIRTRRPKQAGTFGRQLNVDDLADAALSILPKDAYAMVLIVDHDLYEDPDDEFICGRAWGASRVAVVSTARYHPSLDKAQNVEREHAWPLSHCTAYMEARCAEGSDSQERPRKKAKVISSETPLTLTIHPHGNEKNASPLQKAAAAHIQMLPHPRTKRALTGLWLGRVCRTVSHELGHCFGIDHCIYYACSMQGSASISEDARQPPYLCPVDLVKVLHATGAKQEDRYKALLSFCRKHKEVLLFASFAAWLSGVLGVNEV